MSGKVWLVCARDRDTGSAAEIRDVYDTLEEAMKAKKRYERFRHIVLVFECRELDSDGE